jgi:hypothetical protein
VQALRRHPQPVRDLNNPSPDCTVPHDGEDDRTKRTTTPDHRTLVTTCSTSSTWVADSWVFPAPCGYRSQRSSDWTILADYKDARRTGFHAEFYFPAQTKTGVTERLSWRVSASVGGLRVRRRVPGRLRPCDGPCCLAYRSRSARRRPRCDGTRQGSNSAAAPDPPMHGRWPDVDQGGDSADRGVLHTDVVPAMCYREALPNCAVIRFKAAPLARRQRRAQRWGRPPRRTPGHTPRRPRRSRRLIHPAIRYSAQPSSPADHGPARGHRPRATPRGRRMHAAGDGFAALDPLPPRE